MINDTKIHSLISNWKERALNKRYSQEYRLAVSECAFELQTILNDTSNDVEFIDNVIQHLPSKELEDYFLEEEADNYLSSLEAHEQIF